MTQHIGIDDGHEKPDYCGEHCECSHTRDGNLALSQICLVRGPGAVDCTRPKGHDGPHGACGSIPEPDSHPIVSWEDDTE